MLRDVHELLSMPAEAQLVSLCQPFRLPFPDNVQEARQGELSCQVGLKGKKSINRVWMHLQDGKNGLVNDVTCRGILNLRGWAQDCLRVAK